MAVAALLVEGAVALSAGHAILRVVEIVRGAGPAGVALYAAAYVAFTLLLIPGSLLTAAAGLMYGPWLGILLVSPVSVAAATLAFLLGRTAARDFIAGRIDGDPRFKAIDAAIGHRGFRIVLLLRLSPVFPFNLLNYALGATDVRLRDYVLGSFVGMLPGTFMYVYVGSLVRSVASLADGPPAGRATAYMYWAGLAATVAVTLYITRLARAALQSDLANPGRQDAAPECSR